MGSFTVSVGKGGDVRMTEDRWTNGEQRLLGVSQFVVLVLMLVLGLTCLTRGVLDFSDGQVVSGGLWMLGTVVLTVVGNWLVNSLLTWTVKSKPTQDKGKGRK